MPNINGFRPVDHEKIFFYIYQTFRYFAPYLAQEGVCRFFLTNLNPRPQSICPTNFG